MYFIQIIWLYSLLVAIIMHNLKMLIFFAAVMMTCVLQMFCRNMNHPTNWILFTVCGDNITWLFFMVLYLIVEYLCLSYKTYELSKETGDPNMNTLVSGFVECQQEPSKENQEVFYSLPWQICNKRPKGLDEEIIQPSKMQDDKEIPEHSKGGGR